MRRARLFGVAPTSASLSLSLFVGRYLRPLEPGGGALSNKDHTAVTALASLPERFPGPSCRDGLSTDLDRTRGCEPPPPDA
jgi:hypothetical protein